MSDHHFTNTAIREIRDEYANRNLCGMCLELGDGEDDGRCFHCASQLATADELETLLTENRNLRAALNQLSWQIDAGVTNEAMQGYISTKLGEGPSSGTQK